MVTGLSDVPDVVLRPRSLKSFPLSSTNRNKVKTVNREKEGGVEKKEVEVSTLTRRDYLHTHKGTKSGPGSLMFTRLVGDLQPPNPTPFPHVTPP